ncbi:hypothetical protein [Sphingobium sp.]|uniref:hypothetical protein n=1 Tax=Sphingobium sp. TaxID=1912891 RepID=UPI002606387C|nr:hypothetical protein [Sphingobium sp.]
MSEVQILRQTRWNGTGSPAEWIADNCGCETCLASAPNRNGPRVSSSVDLRPDESLISAILRTAAKNHLPRVSRLLAAADGVYHSFVNLASREDVDFTQLAWTARLPAHDVEARRYHRTEIHATLPGVIFHGAVVPAYDIRLKSRRIAPSWLRGEPYHSAIGHHVLVPHCPATGEILIERCPRCDALLSWSQLDMTRCQACDLDLSGVDGERIGEKMRTATSLMADLIHPHPARHLAALERVPSMLIGIDRGVIFELGWRLGVIMAGHDRRDRDDMRNLPVAARLDIMACGSQMLVSWPRGLQNALADHSSWAARADAIASLRHLAAQKSAWPDHRALLLEAIPGLEKSRAETVKLAVVAGGNAAETTQALGVGQKVFERLRASQHLTPALTLGNDNLHQIFDVSPHKQMIDNLSDRIGINSASERLGIGRNGAEQLCCLRHLHLLNQSYMRDAYLERQIRRSGFEKLFDTLETGSCDIDEDDRIPIMQAIRIIGGREKPWGELVHAMVHRDLEYHVDQESPWALMTRVSIRADDVARVAGMRFDRVAFSRFEFGIEMPRRDAERLLNVTPKYMDEAIAAGDLKRNSNGLFDREHVLKRAATFISGGEIIMRWEGGGRRKPAQFRGRRKLERAGPLGWLRSEVEQRMEAEPPRTDFGRL